MKIVFIGTSDFGAIILEKLCKNKHKPILVITALDKPVGRKQLITPPPVKLIAKKYNLSILQLDKIQDAKYKIQETKPDLIVVAAYGQIISKEILSIPKYGSLNIHPSLLPRWRGASPIQYSILKGEEETGVTLILMNEKVDAGPIIARSKFKIQDLNLTYVDLYQKLAELGARLLIETMPKWTAGKIKPKPQDESKATYTKTLKKEDGQIDWRKSAQDIERKIRAFYPWPGVFSNYQTKSGKIKKIKVLEAKVMEQTDTGPFGVHGKTFLASNNKLAVQTGKDFLLISRLQLEGKKTMSSEEFLRGHWQFVGNILQ